jgi:hypothetical protein
MYSLFYNKNIDRFISEPETYIVLTPGNFYHPVYEKRQKIIDWLRDAGIKIKINNITISGCYGFDQFIFENKDDAIRCKLVCG